MLQASTYWKTKHNNQKKWLAVQFMNVSSSGEAEAGVSQGAEATLGHILSSRSTQPTDWASSPLHPQSPGANKNESSIHGKQLWEGVLIQRHCTHTDVTHGTSS